MQVPTVYDKYLSREVIVMEYVPGVKINNGPAIDRMGLDRARLGRLAVESYLQQLLRHGLFHAGARGAVVPAWSIVAMPGPVF